jgi:hypothetical protein
MAGAAAEQCKAKSQRSDAEAISIQRMRAAIDLAKAQAKWRKPGRPKKENVDNINKFSRGSSRKRMSYPDPK